MLLTFSFITEQTSSCVLLHWRRWICRIVSEMSIVSEAAFPTRSSSVRQSPSSIPPSAVTTLWKHIKISPRRSARFNKVGSFLISHPSNIFSASGPSNKIRKYNEQHYLTKNEVYVPIQVKRQSWQFPSGSISITLAPWTLSCPNRWTIVPNGLVGHRVRLCTYSPSRDASLTSPYESLIITIFLSWYLEHCLSKNNT